MVIKVNKDVDLAFKKVVNIAIFRNPIEPFKWIKLAHETNGSWGDDLTCLDELSTEQLMLMYTMGYEVLDEIINTENVVYVILDNNNKFIELDDNSTNEECIYGNESIYKANVNHNYFESVGLLNYINDGLDNHSISNCDVKLPLKVVKVNFKMKVNELDEEIE